MSNALLDALSTLIVHTEIVILNFTAEPDRLIGHQTSRLIEHISSIRIPTLISETEWRATTLNAAGARP